MMPNDYGGGSADLSKEWKEPMTDTPRTFDIKFDSAGDFDKARELIERMNAALAAKEAQINRVREKLQSIIRRLLRYRAHEDHCEVGRTDFCTCGMKQVADAARAALGEPAAEDKK